MLAGNSKTAPHKSREKSEHHAGVVIIARNLMQLIIIINLIYI
ncbi:hypothetical protein FB99_29550 [Pantoea agglomerans]|nr:hypothetical protein FB99_29550 [Pantoea agglomerans]